MLHPTHDRNPLGYNPKMIWVSVPATINLFLKRSEVGTKNVETIEYILKVLISEAE